MGAALVVVILVASLFGAWTNATPWLFNSLAVVIGALALVLLVTRGMRHLRPKESLGFTRDQSVVAYEMSGKGMPRGSYLVAFAAILTIFAGGIRTAYGTLAFTGFALAVAWIRANASYPADRSSG